jgi:GTP-binding protein HflX
MEEMDIQGIPVLNVYNKMDIAKDFVPTLTPAVQLSIKSDEGVQWLRTAILEKLHELFVAFELDLPYAMAYKLPELKKIAMVNEVVEGETAYKVKGIIAPSMTWKLDNY